MGVVVLRYLEVEFIHEWMGHKPLTKEKLLEQTALELERRGTVRILDSEIENKMIDSPIVDKMVKNVPQKKHGKKK